MILTVSPSAQHRISEWSMNDELKKVWKKAVVAYLKALIWNLPGDIKESNEHLQLGQSASLEPCTSHLLIKTLLAVCLL
jgi:hypothetical protein